MVCITATIGTKRPKKVAWADCLLNDKSLRVPLEIRIEGDPNGSSFRKGMRSSEIRCTSSVRNGRHAVNRDDWFAEFHPLRFSFWLQTTVSVDGKTLTETGAPATGGDKFKILFDRM